MNNRIPLLALLAANSISTVGNVLTLVAVPWFVLETTGSAAMAGVTAFFSAVPAIPAAFFGGVVVDRLGHKRASVISDVLSGITVAMVPLLYVTVGLEFWHLLVLMFLGALLDAPGSTARTAIVPELAEMAGMRLEKANAAAQAVFQASFLLGAPLGGVLVAVMGTSNVLWLDAATFALSAAVVGLLVPVVRIAAGPQDERGTYMSDLKAGLKFIWSSRLLVTLVVTVMVTNFLDSPMFSVVMPVYAREVLGSSVDLGIVMGAFGAGAFAGAVLYGVFGHRLTRRALFVSAFVGVAVPLWVLVALPGQPVVTLGALVTGAAAGPINPLIRTVVQERVPAGMRARILGTVSAGTFLAIPLSMVLSGWVIELVGLQGTLFIYAASYLALAVALLLNPAVREMNLPGPFASKPTGSGTATEAGSVGVKV